jgi:septum formation protein
VVNVIRPLVADKNLTCFLASASPRRKELISLLGLDFDVVVPNIEEKRLEGEAPLSYVARNATEKAMAVVNGKGFLDERKASNRPWILLSADTIVIHDGNVLEKPASRQHAKRMLLALSDSEHHVYTSFCLAYQLKSGEPSYVTKTISTKVCFSYISPQDMEWYLDTDEPYDKAGAYGIQGYGALWVKSIEGSYTNVVGLPIAELRETLAFILRTTRP